LVPFLTILLVKFVAKHVTDAGNYEIIRIHKSKVKLSRYTPWRHMGGEEVYSSYSFLTSALHGG
jgi:hypothetical protein